MVALDDLKKEAKRLLEDGSVKYIIGYKRAADGFTSIPAFFKKAKDVDAMVWDPLCYHNLTRFIKEEKKNKLKSKEPDTRPIGIVVKGCDSRAINVLLQENFMERSDIFLLGVSCENSGVSDFMKLIKKSKGKPIKGIEFTPNGGFKISFPDGETEVPANELLAGRCLECQSNVPVVYDIFFGDKSSRSPENPFGSIEVIENLTQEKKHSFWKEKFEDCIRCYACRSVCPMCYCDECVADTINFAVYADTSAEEKAQKIKWVEKSPVSSENFVYHMIRAIHLAGRCIDCGECERACPVDIPIRLLNKKLEKEAKDLFGYEVGYDPEQPSLVSSFKEEDPEDFIR